jgi:hypothetical protein
MHHLHFNFLALLVSALIQWLIGGLWYSLLFRKPWMALTGYLRPANGERPKGAVVAMIASFVISLVLSLMLAHVVIWAGADGFAHGMFLGFICWLGFIAGPLLAQQIYEQRPMMQWAINAGYWLVALLVSGGLLAVWR